MASVHKWLVRSETVSWLIEYTGTTPVGEAKILINGVQHLAPLQARDGGGYVASLPCGLRECLLQMDAAGESLNLMADGVAIAPVAEPEPAAPTAPATADVARWLRRLKSGRSSFLSLIGLSVLNIVLILFNASISFPFSIFSASFAVGIGSAFSEDTGSTIYRMIGVAVAIVIIAAYALLYLLARRRTWPVWTAFGLVIADTLLLIGYAILFEDWSGAGIDLLFHAWIIWSLFRLGQAHLMITRLAGPGGAPAAQNASPDRIPA